MNTAFPPLPWFCYAINYDVLLLQKGKKTHWGNETLYVEQTDSENEKEAFANTNEQLYMSQNRRFSYYLVFIDIASYHYINVV